METQSTQNPLKVIIPRREYHFVNIQDAMKILNMSYFAIRNLIKADKLRNFKSTGGRIYCIHIDDIYKLIDIGKKVAIYLPMYKVDKYADILQKKGITTGLNPLYLVEEHLSHTKMPLIYRKEWNTIMSLWKERKICGVISHANFIGKSNDILALLINLQYAGFYVYVEYGTGVEAYPYRVQEIDIQRSKHEENTLRKAKRLSK